MWKKSESTVQPLKVDNSQSKTKTYLRKNIVSEQRDGATWYVYDEYVLDKEDYNAMTATIFVGDNTSDVGICLNAIAEIYEMIAEVSNG